MRLSELISKSGIKPISTVGDAEVCTLSQDSRGVRPGALFVCNPGTATDSHSFLADAHQKGAVAAAVWSRDGFDQAKSIGLAVIELPEDRTQFNDSVCRICNTFFDYPTRTMKVVGVTGTNGKTTTAWLIRDMLSSLGLKAGYLGTLGFQIPNEERELGNTTPYPVELWTLLAEARDKGVEAIAMEVSSHALAEHRCEYVEFDVGVFTNLTQDHLDFHGSMEEYEAAKLRLFTDLPAQSKKAFIGAINVDDPTGRRWYKRLASLGGEWRPFTSLLDEDIEGSPLGSPRAIEVDHLRIDFRTRTEACEVDVRLGGSFNIENSIAATSAMMALGYSLEEAAIALSKARPVPGRFEPVSNDQGIGILVDYAHTPDALEKLLDAARPLTNGRVITVFGCGGDRDRTKRPKMARAASERSDLTVVTSDNPRTEDPQAILDEVLIGVVPGRESVDIIDRREAIAHAIAIANPGDIVVIAGKGHENYQIIGRTKLPMDDRALVRQALEAKS